MEYISGTIFSVRRCGWTDFGRYGVSASRPSCRYFSLPPYDSSVITFEF